MLPKRDKINNFFNLTIKCIAISALFFISILVIACSNNSTQLNPGTPAVTVTINLGQGIGSPTPTLSPYYCGGWATDTSPAYTSTSTISVFGKFTKIVDGNPVGIGGASATASISWPDGTVDTQTTTTTSDGLAVFPIVIKPSAINKLVTITIVFSSTSPQATCTIPKAAYFTAILVSPAPTKRASPSSSGTPTGSPTPTSSDTPSPTP